MNLGRFIPVLKFGETLLYLVPWIFFHFYLFFQERRNPVPLPNPARLLKPRRLKSLCWRVFRELQKEKCALMSIFTALKLSASEGPLSTQGVLLQGPINLTTMPSSSILWPQSQPWKKLKTITLLCLLSMCELTSPKSRRLWRSCMTLMPQK